MKETIPFVMYLILYVYFVKKNKGVLGYFENKLRFIKSQPK